MSARVIIPIEAIKRLARCADLEAEIVGTTARTIMGAADLSGNVLAEFDRAARAVAYAAEGIRRALKESRAEARRD